MKKLTCKEAKENISINDYLLAIGIMPDKEDGPNKRFKWYKIRIENTASCRVDNSVKWKDFGSGKGGDIIDLVEEINQCSTPDALEMLSKDFSSLQRQIAIAPEEKIDAFEIVKKTDLTNEILNKYIQTRCIDFEVAKQYLKVLYYTHRNRQYFTLGFQNDSGHYEARNSIFKTCIGKKDVTSFTEDKSSVKLFEGQYDFMSYETIFGLEESEGYIVLNSVSMLEKLLPKLVRFNSIEIYFDNDESGKKATARVKESYPRAEDCSSLYKDYNDLNEYLIALRKPK